MNNNKKVILIFSIIGTLFAGYLTISKIFSNICPVKEGCPFIFGFPACLYGFILFLTLLVLSIVSFKKKVMKIIKYFSIIGVLFSLYSIYIELSVPSPLGYSLLLPSCVYGFLFYLTIFIFSNKEK